MRVVICGGGIMGCATAYYLVVKQGIKDVTIVERVEIAGQASGKAGGFLAKDWCDSRLSGLAEKSYSLHEQLSSELGCDIGYRQVDTISVYAQTGKSSGKVEGTPDWLDGNVRSVDRIGNTSSTAQVHPKLLTEAFLSKAKEGGAKVIIGSVEGVILDGQTARGVRLADGAEIPADKVVIALGPWSGLARKWFPSAGLPEITGNRAHSVVVDAEVSAHCVFLTYDAKEPEIYPRPDGTVYVCGQGDKEPLPADPADVEFSDKSCDVLKEALGGVASGLKDAKVQAKQACYLPLNKSDGVPLIGKVSGYEDAYIATGHTVWGILNGPATGLAMAELVATGKATSVDLANFDPGRFRKS